MKDILGNEISEGSWLIRAYNHYRTPALKYCYVLKYLESGEVETIGFDCYRFKSDSNVAFKIDVSSGKNSKLFQNSLLVNAIDVPEEVMNIFSESKYFS